MTCFIYLLVQGCVVWKNAHQSKICGDYYGSFKKILAILAIFCVLVSAGAVCAADDFGQLGSNYADDSGYAGSNYQDDGGWAGSQYNETLENATANAAGEPTNATNATNITAQAAGEPTNATNATESVQSMLSTGNPILILLVVVAVLGGYVVYKRR